MTQVTQFALVLVCVAVASIWALAKGRVKWFLLIVGAFVAWLVLPSVILQTKWGYYREDGATMAGRSIPTFHESEEPNSKWAIDLATEVCGDAEGFDTQDPTLHSVAMPEQAMVEHLFYYGRYTNVIWFGLGWKDRFCLARYLVAERRDASLYWMPTQLFPYLFVPLVPHTKRLEDRLLERLPPPPKAPEGVRSLLPGQCVTGELAKGETARFQVQMPYFGQRIGLDVDLECVYETDYEGLVGWTRNGNPIAGLTDASNGGGLYQITLRAPTTEAKPYIVGVFWGVRDHRCHRPKGWWWDRCRRVQDPDATGVNPN
jgi:hypothetical protein